MEALTHLGCLNDNQIIHSRPSGLHLSPQTFENKKLSVTGASTDNEHLHLQCRILCVSCADLVLSMLGTDSTTGNTPHTLLQLIDGICIPQMFHLLSRGFILEAL